MQSRKERLKNSKLYLILDAGVNTYEELFELVKKSVAFGIDIIQLRDKKSNAKKMLELSRQIVNYIDDHVLFIVNDRLDIALAAKADGVHVGQDDLPLKDVKRLVQSDFIVGVSCQNYENALEAQTQGADYIGFGSVFKTLTKPERLPMDQNLLRKVVKEIKIPVFLIGGINLENAQIIRNCGASRMAVCRSLAFSQAFEDDVKSFKQILNAK